MKTKTIGVCVIGTGRAGMIHARNFRQGIPGARLAALVEPVAEARNQAGRELELETLLKDWQEAVSREEIDAVVISTPTVFHREVAVAAAAAGKHILCEKPMALNPAECNAMIQAADANRVALQIAFMRRFDKNFIQAKARILAGDIGRVVLVKSLTHGPSEPRPWMLDVARSNGPLAEIASHDIDTLRWFAESEFEEVFAMAGNYRTEFARKEYPEFYDNVLMSVRFNNGMQGLVEGAAHVRYGYDSRTEVLGTEGVIWIGGMRDTSVSICSAGKGINASAVKSWQTLYTDAYRTEDESFIRSILEGRPPEVTGMDGLRAVEAVNAGNLSIKERRPVKLAEVSR